MKKTFLIAFTILSSVSFAQKNKNVDPPKLVVGIVIDQMRYEYLYRFYNDFGKGGFKRLMEKGMNCRNTSYNYVPTYTGPGHASIYTGTTPSNHGIVANSWFSNEENKVVNCVEDSSVVSVGGSSAYGKFSPNRLKANTITDQLKISNSKSKVISVSLKNRGAILPGGHMSDGSYWFDYETGNFITSSYFQGELPEWVKEFNAQKYPDKSLNQTWDLFLESDDYTESREDNYAYEALLPSKITPEFPYDFSKINDSIETFDLFGYTPFSNSILLDLAKSGIKSEDLGQDEHADFLNVSISATDIIGHAFGPFSKEIHDTYVRLDRDLAAFFEYLDKNVGKNDYLVFLTADHAVEPIPQYLIEHKLTANYFGMDELKEVVAQSIKRNLEGQLRTEMKDSTEYSFIKAIKNQQVYLNLAELNALEVDVDLTLKEIKSNVEKMSGVKYVFSKDDLMSNNHRYINNLVGKGVHPKESGDLIILLEPGYLSVGTNDHAHKKGTSHGSPYGYDTDVPLLWYGWETPVKEVFREINITDITATLKRVLNVQKPNACTGKTIVELFKK